MVSQESNNLTPRGALLSALTPRQQGFVHLHGLQAEVVLRNEILIWEVLPLHPSAWGSE